MSLLLRLGLSQLFLQWYSCTQPSFLLSSLAEVFPLYFLEALTSAGYFSFLGGLEMLELTGVGGISFLELK